MISHRILVVWSGPETGTSANLFKALRDILAQRHEVRTVPNGIVPGTRLRKIAHHVACELRRWPQLIQSDTVVFHSYVALSLPSVLLARTLCKRIVVVHWDAYPITIDGQRLGGRFRALFNRIEHFAVGLATRVVIPTEDFSPFVRYPSVRVLPLWPSLPIGAVKARSRRMPGEPIRLAFVGQAGLTRGLPEAIKRLSREAPTSFELHIFSPNPPMPEWLELAPNVRIVARDYLPRQALLAALDDMDFGLISLHPKMGQPGFPSKVFDYVAAGLFVIYSGRPMPAFESLLERTGVGKVVREQRIDWDEALYRPTVSMSASVRAFEDETRLTIEKVERAFF